MVGTRTSIAMTVMLLGECRMRAGRESSLSDTRSRPTRGSARTCTTAPHSHSRVYRRIHDVDLFLGHHVVHDTERPDLLALRIPGRHEKVVGAGLAGEGDVGTGRVRLRRGVRVVDDHRLLVVVVHLTPDS